MSVHLPRADYLAAVPDWHRVRCAVAGRSAILSDVSTFLPMTKRMRRNTDMYRIFTERALWYGAASRTLDAWVGSLTRKPLNVEVPSRYRWRLENIDGQGSSLDAFARRVAREVCAVGRFGILVDVGNPTSAADPRSVPYLAGYVAETIKSWRTRMTVEGIALDQVILEETEEVPHSSGFGVTTRTIYRVLELDEDSIYRCRIFVMNDGEAVEIQTIYPSGYPSPNGGSGYFNFIPFVIVGPTGLSPTIEKAPLLDVVDANISHYQTSADYEFSLYWSASPTAVLTGLTDDDANDYEIGGGALWKLPMHATASYLEFKGSGLAPLQAALDDKRELIASLGAALLSQPKRAVETAEALTIRSSGESASLITVSDSISKALTLSLRIAATWGYMDGPVKVELNKDLVSTRLSAEDFKALMLAVQNGLLSLDDYYHNLQMGEILRPGISIEEARDATEMQSPILSGRADPAIRTERELPSRRGKRNGTDTAGTSE